VKVQVKLFAVAKQLAGSETVEVELPAGATVAQLRAALAAQSPPLAHLASHAMFAINAEYAENSTPIPPAAEIACIPPVSGG
jgi:molybdopterin converting factor subunit 1